MKKVKISLLLLLTLTLIYLVLPKQQITIHTPFNLASISKPVTGIALIQLVDQGLLDLDQDINSYAINQDSEVSLSNHIKSLLTPEGALSIQQSEWKSLSTNFEKDFQNLNLPVFKLGYVQNIIQTQSKDSLLIQEQFFKSIKKALKKIK